MATPVLDYECGMCFFLCCTVERDAKQMIGHRNYASEQNAFFSNVVNHAVPALKTTLVSLYSAVRVLRWVPVVRFHGWSFHKLVLLGAVRRPLRPSPGDIRRPVVHRNLLHRVRAFHNLLVGVFVPVSWPAVHCGVKLAFFDVVGVFRVGTKPAI